MTEIDLDELERQARMGGPDEGNVSDASVLALIARVRRAEKALAAIRKLEKSYDYSSDWGEHYDMLDIDRILKEAGL